MRSLLPSCIRCTVQWIRLALCMGASGLGTLDRVSAAPREVTFHEGMANASAVAVVAPDLFCVASDEDNRLRMFRADTDGPELSGWDLSGFLRLQGHSIEADLEAAARIGDRIYWIGSHSRNKEGKYRPNRHRLFATQIQTNGALTKLEPIGQPYAGLVDALATDPRLRPFGLARAARLRPEDEGGLNIEGLAAGPGGELWIGFRSPVPNGRALLVPLLNPAGVIQLERPEFGEPRLLDLDGLGIRDMVWTGQNWYLIAGRPGSGGNSRLYRWPGGNQPPERIEKPGFKKFNPEAIAAFGTAEHPRLLVLSDDGNAGRNQTGTSRKFRSFWVEP